MSQQIITSIYIILLTVTGKFIATAVIDNALRKIKPKDDSEHTKTITESRAKTIGNFLKNGATVFIFGTAFISLLSEWGIDIRPIITGAGVLGLAVGFGSQALVKDIVTGFFIILENQYNVGDKVKVAGLEGYVQELNIRYTILRTDDGIIHTIPNSSISVVSRLNNAKTK